MKKSICLIMVFAMLLALCACQGRERQVLTEPTAVPSEAAQSFEPTALPTEAPAKETTEEPTELPTEAPTEEPTPEPTAVPEPVELSFKECAEVAARLPWGTGDNEVYFEPPDESEELVPQRFYVADGKVYVLDRWLYQGAGGMIVCDIETGELSRVNFTGTQQSHYTAFAIDGGRVIDPFSIYDIKTGKETVLQRPPLKDSPLECARSIRQKDGAWYLYIAEPWFIGSEQNEHPIVTEYLLDEENLLWQPVREYMRDGWEKIELLDGGTVLDSIFEEGHSAYAGYDDAGNHYVVTEGGVHGVTLSKLTPEGHVEKYVELDTSEEYHFPMVSWGFNVQVDPDGTVWLMMLYEKEVVIFKLSL